MRIRRIYNWITAMTVLLTAVFCFDSMSSLRASAADGLTGQPELKTDYMVGETVTIPECSLQIDGKEHETETVVYLPNGLAVRNSEITLNQIGNYTVQYKAKVDGWWYSDCVTFCVSKKAFHIEGTPSSTSAYDAAEKTVELDLAELDTFNFNHVIDLNGKTKDDALISMYVTSKETNVRDFETLVVVLTDVYDASNKVYIRLVGDWSNIYHPEDFSSNDPDNIYKYARYQSYLSVNLDGGDSWTFQDPSSEVKKPSTVQFGGVPVYFSLCNEAYLRDGCAGMTQREDLLTLAYDAETNALYHLGATPYPGERMIADLDDPEYFDGAFKGFTNNEVYVSVYADDVYSSANITITDIAGTETLNADVADKTAPEISVDYQSYDKEELPSAIVGKPYGIYSAAARDLNICDAEVLTEVYLDYGTERQTMVNVADGAFTPDAAGVYSIVYTKADAFGNVGKEVAQVTAVADAKELQIQISDFTATAGELDTIKMPKILSSDERTGRLTLTVTAEHNGTEETICQGWLDECRTAAYRYMMTGDWKVTYTVADHSQSVTETVTCQVKKGSTMIYDQFEELQIDETLITGNTYYLPVVKVVDFTDEETIYTDASIKVNYNGKWMPVVGNRLTVTEKMGDAVHITYYDEENPECEIYGVRGVVDIGTTGDYHLDRLFTSDNADLETTSASLNFTADENAKIRMITKQNAEELALTFRLNGKEQNFKNLHVLLTDSEDDDIQLRITLENLAEPIVSESQPTAYSRMYLNGETADAVNLQTGFADSQKYYTISYANMTHMVSCTDAADSRSGLTAVTGVNGEAFEGFPSGMVYITFEMEVTGASSELILQSINSQAMSEFGEDFSSPAIVMDSSYASTCLIDETVSTVTARGMDVINGFCNARITVQYMGGGIVSTIDGTPIDKLDAAKSYEFVADEYGEYVIYYSSTDASGNTNDSVYRSFHVVDLEKPSMKLRGKTQSVVWVDTEFEMPKLKVEDNCPGTLYPTAIIVTPGGQRRAVSDEGFVFDEAGSYRVILVVYDAEGNKAQTAYYVEVVENAK